MKKKAAKKAVRKKLTPGELFAEWWDKKGGKKVSKIEKAWIKSNEPNGEDEDGGGDHWHVNRMMHDGDAHEMTWDIAERAFLAGHNGEKWEPDMSDSLFCDLDEVVNDAYLAGKESVS